MTAGADGEGDGMGQHSLQHARSRGLAYWGLLAALVTICTQLSLEILSNILFALRTESFFYTTELPQTRATEEGRAESSRLVDQPVPRIFDAPWNICI